MKSGEEGREEEHPGAVGSELLFCGGWCLRRRRFFSQIFDVRPFENPGQQHLRLKFLRWCHSSSRVHVIHRIFFFFWVPCMHAALACRAPLPSRQDILSNITIKPSGNSVSEIPPQTTCTISVALRKATIVEIEKQDMATRQQDSVAPESTQDVQDNGSGPQTEGQITAENVKNFKRKVISIAKLKEVFEKKEQGMLDLQLHFFVHIFFCL